MADISDTLPIIGNVKSAYTVLSVKGSRFKMENRREYGISLCESGRINYIHNGETIVSTPNVAVLLPMGESYEIEHIDGGIFPLVNFVAAEINVHDFMVFPVTDKTAAISVYNDIRAAVDGKNNLLAISHLYRLFAMLCHPASPTPIDEITAYLSDNFGNADITNLQLANTLHISEVYLRKLFKKYTGLTPHAYLQDLRLREARRLLEESDCFVSEIAEKCGFSGVYHFSRCFKQSSGMSPIDYRASVKKNIF